MLGARRRDRFGPPSVLLGTAALLTALMPAAFSAATTSGATRCPSSAMDVVRHAQRGTAGRSVKARLEQRLSSRGELTGRVLRVERPGVAGLAISLPAESFVADPVGDAIVYTRVLEGRSEVRLIDAVTGCDTHLASPSEIVRSAILEPSGAAVYVHTVKRLGRRDAGVVRHDLASGAVTLAVPPLGPQPGVGRIFGTELRWSLDSRSLAVQSCGFARCLTRVLDVGSGALTVFDAPGQGALIGTTPGHVITYGACPGLPAPVIGIDRRTGDSEVLEPEAFGVTLTSVGGTYFLTIETASGLREVVL